MIYTVTLNPAIDKTIYVDDFKLDTVNRIQTYRSDPGGKGINVTKMIQNLEGESVAITILGGGTGRILEELMDHEEVNSKIFNCSGETRINTKVVDKVTNKFTDINEPGPTITRNLIREIEEYLKETLVPGDILVLSGSVPKGVPVTIYKDWSKLGKSLGAKVLLDADKKLLEEGIDGAPYMIKPNEKELGSYFGVETTEPEQIVEQCKKLFAKGVEVIVVSLGKEGCLLLTNDSSVIFKSIEVEVKSTVGAGDSMLAAIAYSLDNKKADEITLPDLVDAVTLGVSASSASIEREGTIMGEKSRILELRQYVNYRNVD